MNKNEIIEILQDWNFWGRELETGVRRPSYLERLDSLLGTNQVLTVTGPRRAGKSFLMRQAAHALLSQGVDKANVLMVNFEDPRFPELNVKLLGQIDDAYLEFLNPKGVRYVFLDEVQEVAGWEKWVRSMHELRKAKLVVSGSNAKLLSQELGTLLTGRHLDLTVFPLSFREMLAFKGVTVDGPMLAHEQRIEIQGQLRTFLEFGAFPEVVLTAQEQKQVLLSYFEDLVTKDLLRRFKVRKPQELKALVKFYVSNPASLTTFYSISRFLNISSSTVEKFSTYLEQVYLIFFLKRFSFTVKEQEKSPRKVYAIDTGLSHAVGFHFSENIGHMAENAVFLELKRRQALNPALEFYYWKDIHHREVDFVVKDGSKIQELIQVCWNAAHPQTKERELRSLAKAMDELKASQALVITEEYEAEEAYKGKSLLFVPLWKWLLEQ